MFHSCHTFLAGLIGDFGGVAGPIVMLKRFRVSSLWVHVIFMDFQELGVTPTKLSQRKDRLVAQGPKTSQDLPRQSKACAKLPGAGHHNHPGQEDEGGACMLREDSKQVDLKCGSYDMYSPHDDVQTDVYRHMFWNGCRWIPPGHLRGESFSPVFQAANWNWEAERAGSLSSYYDIPKGSQSHILFGEGVGCSSDIYGYFHVTVLL